MLGIDSPHGRYQTDQPGADAGVRSRRWLRRVPGRRPGREVRLRRADAAASGLPTTGPGRQRTGQTVPEQADRIGPRPVDASDRVLCRERIGAVAPYQRRKFPARYTEADVRLLAYVDQAHGTLSGPATRRILQREYNEYHIQPTSDWPTSVPPRSIVFAKPPSIANAIPAINPRGPRRSPSASAASPIPTAGPATCASTRCTRETGWRQGLVSHQRGGSSHAMASGGGHAAHLRSLAVAVVGNHAGAVSFPHPRLSFRQRQRVHQLPSLRLVEQAPHRADQVAAPSFRRQRAWWSPRTAR